MSQSKSPQKGQFPSKTTVWQIIGSDDKREWQLNFRVQINWMYSIITEKTFHLKINTRTLKTVSVHNNILFGRVGEGGLRQTRLAPFIPSDGRSYKKKGIKKKKQMSLLERWDMWLLPPQKYQRVFNYPPRRYTPCSGICFSFHSEILWFITEQTLKGTSIKERRIHIAARLAAQTVSACSKKKISVLFAPLSTRLIRFACETPCSLCRVTSHHRRFLSAQQPPPLLFGCNHCGASTPIIY